MNNKSLGFIPTIYNGNVKTTFTSAEYDEEGNLIKLIADKKNEGQSLLLRFHQIMKTL